MKGKEKKDILSVLEARLPTFSKGGRVIARYILDNYDKAAFMTAARMGAAVGVSESTVVRFAAELGYRGYPGMKKALQEVVRGRLTSVERIEHAESTMPTQDVLKAVLRADIHNLQATLDEIDQPSFDKAVELIRGAKNVYIVGMRTSTTLARFLWLYLNVLRENVFVIQDTAAAEVYEQLLRVKEGDLVIGICFPRYSNRTVNVMSFAQQRGASTLGITDSKSSPLNDSSTVCLFAKSEMVSFLDSLVAPMGLINALIAAVGIQDKARTFQTFRELEQIWKEYGVYQINED
jgi:DNA-binding MurR/RpiR family transcriptional regulator